MKHMSSSNPSLNRVSSNVTDVSTSSVASSTDSDRDLGVKIYDTPAMREEIKKKNATIKRKMEDIKESFKVERMTVNVMSMFIEYRY